MRTTNVFSADTFARRRAVKFIPQEVKMLMWRLIGQLFRILPASILAHQGSLLLLTLIPV